MIEYVQARVRVNNFTMFTVVNLIERVETLSVLEMGSTIQINFVCLTFKMFRINRQAANRFLEPDSKKSGKIAEVCLLSEKRYGHDVIDVPRKINGGYL